MRRNSNIFIIRIVIIIISLNFIGCRESSIPKPYGYFRVDLPEHSYRKIDTLGLPYTFDLAKEAAVINRENGDEKFWIDIYYPQLNASVYCSYKPIKNNLLELLEDTRKIVYKHSIKADGINEKVFEARNKKVFGILYDLKGNTASSLQFVLTDSTQHFFRGALYFNNVPNKDSIVPMAEFIRKDMIRLMESFEWKNNKK